MNDDILQDRDGAGKAMSGKLTNKVGTDSFRTAIIKDGDTTTMLRTKGGMREVTMTKVVAAATSCKLFPLEEIDEAGEDTQNSRQYYDEPVGASDGGRIFSHDGVFSIPSNPLKLALFKSGAGRLNVWLNNYSATPENPADWSGIEQVVPEDLDGGKDVVEILQSAEAYNEDEYQPKTGGEVSRRYYKPIMVWRKEGEPETPELSFVVARLKSITFKVAGFEGRRKLQFSRVNPNTRKVVEVTAAKNKFSETAITDREYITTALSILRKTHFTEGVMTTAVSTSTSNKYKNGGFLSPMHNGVALRFQLEEIVEVQQTGSVQTSEVALPANDLSTILAFGQPRHGLLNLETGELLDPVTYANIGDLGPEPFGGPANSAAISVLDFFWQSPEDETAIFGEFKDGDGNPVKHTRTCPVINGRVLPNQGESLPLLSGGYSNYYTGGWYHSLYFLYRDDTGGKVHRLHLVSSNQFETTVPFALYNTGRFDNLFDDDREATQEYLLFSSSVVSRHLTIGNSYASTRETRAGAVFRSFPNGKSFSCLSHIFDISGNVATGLTIQLRVRFDHGIVRGTYRHARQIDSLGSYGGPLVNPDTYQVLPNDYKLPPPSFSGSPSGGTLSYHETGHSTLDVADGMATYSYEHTATTIGSHYGFGETDIMLSPYFDRATGGFTEFRSIETYGVRADSATTVHTTRNATAPIPGSSQASENITTNTSSIARTTESLRFTYTDGAVMSVTHTVTNGGPVSNSSYDEYVFTTSVFTKSFNYDLSVSPPGSPGWCITSLPWEAFNRPAALPEVTINSFYPHGEIGTAVHNELFQGVEVYGHSEDPRTVYYKSQSLYVPEGHSLCYDTTTDRILTLPFGGHFVII